VSRLVKGASLGAQLDERQGNVKPRYKAALTVLIGILTVGAFSASAAFAAPEWYSTTMPAVHEWQQGGVALSEATPVKWKGTVWISDSYLEYTAKCEDSGEGTVGPGAAGQATAWTFSGCKLEKTGYCEKFDTKVVNASTLPWGTELVIAGGALYNKTKVEAGSGKFTVNCNSKAIGKFADPCNVPLTALKNTGSGVEATFASEKVNCGVGGSGTGTVTGTQVIEATKGAALEAFAGDRGTFAKLTSALAVKGSGELTLEDTAVLQGLACSVATEGTIAAAGKGTLTSYTVSGCKVVGADRCETPTNFAALHLPWNTELSLVEGRIRNRIISGGSGTPEWQYECANMLSPVRCAVNTNPLAVNGIEGNVFVRFDEEASKTECTGSGAKEAGKWRGELIVAHPAGVGAIQVK
jgi:hypothetical protein